MIAVDTNVLLRRLLNDGAVQAEKARRLFESEESILVTDVVLAEATWTLTGKRYSAGRDDIAIVVMGLREEHNVVFDCRQAVWSTLNDCLDAMPVRTPSGIRIAEPADALIVIKARITAQDRQERYGGTYTCDQAALALYGTKAPCTEIDRDRGQRVRLERDRAPACVGDLGAACSDNRPAK